MSLAEDRAWRTGSLVSRTVNNSKASSSVSSWPPFSRSSRTRSGSGNRVSRARSVSSRSLSLSGKGTATSSPTPYRLLDREGVCRRRPRPAGSTVCPVRSRSAVGVPKQIALGTGEQATNGSASAVLLAPCKCALRTPIRVVASGGRERRSSPCPRPLPRRALRRRRSRRRLEGREGGGSPRRHQRRRSLHPPMPAPAPRPSRPSPASRPPVGARTARRSRRRLLERQRERTAGVPAFLSFGSKYSCDLVIHLGHSHSMPGPRR